MSSTVRLYFPDKIQSDLSSHLPKEQTHYVKDVMRLKIGDKLSIFNNLGEWNALIESYEKNGAKIKIMGKVRDKDNEKNIWLAFSPIKQNPLNFVIQKGTEISKIIEPMATSDGAGVKLKRSIGTPLIDYLDPFLMLDEFGSENKDDYIGLSFVL